MSRSFSRVPMAFVLALTLAFAGCLSDQDASSTPPPPADPPEEDMDLIDELIGEVPVPPVPPLPPPPSGPDLPPVP